MPTTTPNYGFRIPNADGEDFQTPEDIRVPVTQIDTRIKNVYDKIAGVASDLDDLDEGGWKKGTVTSSGTATSFYPNPGDYSIQSVYYKMQLDMVYIIAYLTRTGPTVPAGNIVNNSMFFVPKSLAPARTNGSLGTSGSGPWFNAFASSDRGIYMATLAQNLAKGLQISVSGSWMR